MGGRAKLVKRFNSCEEFSLCHTHNAIEIKNLLGEAQFMLHVCVTHEVVRKTEKVDQLIDLHVFL